MCMIIEEMLGETKYYQQERRDTWTGICKALGAQYDEYCQMLTTLQIQQNFFKVVDLIKVSVHDDLINHISLEF